MKIYLVKTGYYKENCYLITIDNSTLIIDPGDDYEAIKKTINENNLKVVGFLITHYHFDHISALKQLKNDYNVPVVDIYNRLIIPKFKYEIIETKGHTDDSISFYFKNENILFCGDFIFKGSIGRYDFESSSKTEMINSIKNIKKLNVKLKIYPGHGDPTTLEYELANNNYMRQLC